MTNEDLKQLAESNARTIQAILDRMVEDRRERQKLREGMIRVQNAIDRLVNVQEGITNILASLDEERLIYY